MSSALDVTWGGFLVAWCFALVDSLFGIADTFLIINGGTPTASEMLPKYEAVLSGFVLPGLLTTPIVWLVMTGRATVSRASRWFTAAVMLACIDLVVISLLTVAIFGVRVSPDGTVEWTFGPQ